MLDEVSPMVVKHCFVEKRSRLWAIFVLALARVDRLPTLALDRQAATLCIVSELCLEADPVRFEVLPVVFDHVL